MRLATLQVGGVSTAAVQHNDSFIALPVTDVAELLRIDSWQQLVNDHLADDASVSVSDAEYLTLIPSPGKILCAGLNYSEHILEMGRELPDHPTLFAKFADTLTGPYSTLEFDDTSQKIDWEAELAVVIGTRISHGTIEDATSAIAGYTIANDISMRDWQQRTTQWLQGKAFDRSTPIGPVLVTPDECDPASGLSISCALNGNVMQLSDTSTLVFGAAEIVAYISSFTVLRPGDIVLTGTPGGVGTAQSPPRFLADGDLLVTAIEGIGELRNLVHIG